MKHLIVANLKAGAKKADDFIEKIKEAFEGLDYEVYETTGPRSVIPYLKEFTLKFFPVKKNGRIYDKDKVYFSPYTKTSAKNLTYKVLNTIINNSLKIKSKLRP